MKQKLLNSFRLRAIMLTAMLVTLCTGTVWGETTYSMTIDSSNNGSNNVHWTATTVSSLTYATVTWSTSVTGTTSVTASTTYAQIGSKNNPASQVTISTTAFAGKKITAASLTGFCMSNTGPSLTITAGSTSILSNASLVKTTSTPYSANVNLPVTLGNSDALTFTISSSAKAAICISEISVTYEEAGGGSTLNPSDLAITNDPVALNFDLYNNATAQTVSYTTSSTGAITITPSSPTSYFSYVHDAVNKTITVTPLAVTPSAQTITISQEADATYNAGSKTFTVSVANSAPMADIAALTANTTAGSYNVSLDDAIVTYVNGSNAYIQDASGAVAMYKSGHGLTAGDVLNGTATVSYQLHNNNPQITDLSGVTPTSGTAPVPTSVAASSWSYTFSDVLSQYFQITGATITTNNNKYYVSLGGENIQLYKASGNLSIADLSRTYTITGFPTLYNSTKELQIFADPVVEATSDPVITVSSSLTNFTYEVGDGPSTAQSFTVSGENLTDDISLSLSGSDFEMSLTEGSGYTNSLTLTQSAGVVASTTVYVRLKADKAAGSYNGTITLTSTGATNQSVSLSGSVTAPEAPNVTWDLTTNSYSLASTTEVSWTSSQATMTLAKGTSSTNANNYLGGSGSYTHTRLYQNQTLTIAPASGYQIVSAEITAMSSYVAGFTGNDWTNATASTSGTTITVIPTNGTQEMSVTISGACRATAVTVYYATNATPSIAVNTTLNVTCNETDGTIDVTYNNIADNSSAEVILCDSEGNTTTYDWIEVELDNDKDVYYVIAANNGAERTGYLKVKVGDVTSEIVTITQAEYVVINTYTLATSITSGKHYVIANNGGTKVMGGQTNNNRASVDATLSNNTLSIASNAGAREVVICGPDANGHYTIYDENAPGYLYAASSSSNWLRTQENNDDNGKWTITLSDGEADITAQGPYTRNVMKFNEQNSIFSCYESGQADIYLYEKSGEATPTETVSVGPAGYTTYTTVNPVSFPEGVTAYIATQVNTNTIHLEAVSDAPARTPLIIQAAEGNHTLTSGTSSASSVSGNLLLSSDGNVAGGENIYALSKNGNVVGFNPVSSEVTIPAGKAYLDLSGSGVKGFLSFDFGSTDGIEAIDNEDSSMVNGQCSMSNVIFNLAGQRVSKAQRGLYIVNGKKVLVK